MRRITKSVFGLTLFLSLSVFSQSVLRLDNSSSDFPARIYDLQSGRYLSFIKSGKFDRYELNNNEEYQLRILPPKDEDGFPDVYHTWNFRGVNSYPFERFSFNSSLFRECKVVGIRGDGMGLELRLISDGSIDDTVKIFSSSSSSGEAFLDRLGLGPYLICCYSVADTSFDKVLEYRILPTLYIGGQSSVKWGSLPILQRSDPLVVTHEKLLAERNRIRKAKQHEKADEENPFGK